MARSKASDDLVVPDDSVYTIDEIITSISGRPVRAGLVDAPTDTVDPRRYLQNEFGPTTIRVHSTRVPVSTLHILQPDIELWRYLRLLGLGQERFLELATRQPLAVVRGKMIQGFPVLEGNHRALYALMHGIEELPARVHVLAEEDAAFAFLIAAERQYEVLDVKFGGHGVPALREAYKRLLSEVVEVHKRKAALTHPGRVFSTRTQLYRDLRQENEAISAEVPCISIEGYIQTLQKTFGVRRDALRLSYKPLYYRGLVLTQHAVEADKLRRVSKRAHLLHAPIIVLRTRLLDYIVVGHARLRGRLDAGFHSTNAILIHLDDDAVNRFLNSQAHQAEYLTGNEGLRRMEIC